MQKTVYVTTKKLYALYVQIQVSVVNGVSSVRLSTLPSKNSSCLKEAAGAYCGTSCPLVYTSTYVRPRSVIVMPALPEVPVLAVVGSETIIVSHLCILAFLGQMFSESLVSNFW